MGLRALIYRNKQLGDCSNEGVSSRTDQVTVVNVEGPFEPTEDAPPVLLMEGNVPGAIKIVPAARITGPGAAVEYHGDWAPLLADGDKTIGPMMGGCYVASGGDSRFREAIAKLGSSADAMPLHDRYETASQYASLSI